MTMTRGMDDHQYRAATYEDALQNGYVRTEVVNNIPQTWAIARPTASPVPLYSPPATLRRNPGFGGFTPAAPTVQMDPSDPSTWQRQYRFT